MVCIPIYDAVLVPLARLATGKERGLSQLQRLGVGLALSVVGMVYAALVEARRLALARTSTPMSIMWQAPAFAVLGAGEVFTAIGILEFFYDQSPGGMKSLGTALGQLSIARWELPQLGGAWCRRRPHGAWREARVDPGRPERRAPELLLLVDGCAGHGESVALLVLLPEM